MGGVKKILDIIEIARSEKKQKSGALAYWSKIDDKFLLNYVSVSFLKKDRKDVKVILEDTQNEPGFLFWANSEDGERFYEENYDKIVRDINTQQIKPWLHYEYEIKKPK
jgi:hypothetical protein